MRMRRIQICLLAAATLLVSGAEATVLTFDVAGISNFQVINQNYGDRVTALADAVGSYDEQGEGFTGNVEVDFGTIDPSLWISGYSDLTNVFFEDADFQGPLEVVLTADAGYNVELYDFDLGSYISSRTVNSVRVFDENDNILFESLSLTISGTTHTDILFQTPLVGQSLTISIDQSNLGGQSDDVALDNIRFGQTANAPVPEPATMTLIGMGLAAMAARSRRRKA